MATDKIIIKGAREHNLKNIDLEMPRDKLIVITGLSGSGKSSLAFDTIYAEGQRRYVESLSSYARQFLGLMEKPDVDYIEGLSPAISIDQRTTSKNPRSTVGTVTEIYDYLRLLYARIGIPHCYKCGREISQQSATQIIDQILELPEDSRIQILAPVVRERKGEYKKIFGDIRREGYVRVRVDGEVRSLDEEMKLDRYKRHSIEVVVDRLVIKDGIRNRLADSVETALDLGEGIVKIDVVGSEELTFSEHFTCIECGINFEELTPRMFSFNSPFGACPECGGLGEKMELDPDLIVPDKSLSVGEGAIASWGEINNHHQHLLTVARHYNFSLDTPFEQLSKKAQEVLVYGSGREEIRFTYQHRNGKGHGEYTGRFEGAYNNLARRYRQTSSEWIRNWIRGFMSVRDCPACGGKRLRPESVAVTVGGRSIVDVSAMSIKQALDFFTDLKLGERDMIIAHQVLKEIRERLGFLVNVGLDYLTLDRAAATLSGGESQRIRLATQIGSSLMGVLYILDEPSIGLHQRDNKRLLATLKRLRDLGNTLIVVEHDEETIRTADYIVDMGPGAGIHGGGIVVTGSIEDITSCPESITGKYLKRELEIEVPEKRRPIKDKWLTVKGARHNNLKNIDVRIPLGVFTCITGVSGSGKSSLVNDILHKALARKLHRAQAKPGDHDYIIGAEHLDKVIIIDQSPIGRTPRSNPATYTKAFTPIREIFSRVPEARIRGYKVGRFSFNVKGGRCEACRGDGIIKIEMHFLPDVYVPCEVCKGKRYNRETLEIRYKGKNISEVLDMTVEEALKFFENIPRIKRILQTLYDVGLGYIKLGQSATTLSGGEAQRVKLSTELSKRSTGKTLYILDEPTTGLHFADVHKLLDVLGRLTDAGNSVLVIEHNLDVVKTADYIIDLGPEGGDEGGWIVAEGTPEKVMRHPTSYTGDFLERVLNHSG